MELPFHGPEGVGDDRQLVAGAAQRPQQVYGTIDPQPRHRGNELLDERDGRVELVVRYYTTAEAMARRIPPNRRARGCRGEG